MTYYIMAQSEDGETTQDLCSTESPELAKLLAGFIAKNIDLTDASEFTLFALGKSQEMKVRIYYGENMDELLIADGQE